MKKQILIISCIVLLAACSKMKQHKQEKELRSITIEAPSEEILFSEIFKEQPEVIKLQTTEKSMIKYASDVKFMEDKIFVLSRTRIESQFRIFNRDGGFFSQLNRQGKGPGEYVRILCFALNRKNGKIYIYDDGSRKILTFDNKLNFIEEKEIPFTFWDIKFIPPHYFAFRASGSNPKKYRYHVILTDNNFNITDKFLPSESSNEGTIGSEYFIRTPKGNLLFAPNWLDTVYSISANGVKPQYQIEFNKDDIPPKRIYQRGSKAILKSDYIYSHMLNVINNKAVIQYYTDEQRHLSIIDMESEKQIFADNKIKDDMGFFLDNPKISFFNKNKIGYTIYPSSLSKKKEKHPDRNLHPAIQSMERSDNPALILFELREDIGSKQP